jgi:beta-phosphoglucomutase family hydrolase
MPGFPVSEGRFDAVLFDLDGVLTDTAALHAEAWRETFDDFLRSRAETGDEPFVPFDPNTDYRTYVDGKPRYDGVRDFLASRHMILPEGTPDDPPTADTVAGLGNRKNALVIDLIERRGVEPLPELLRANGVRTAVVSSSANAGAVLRAAGLENLFDTRVDGITAREAGLPGKPAPATFLVAAERLGTTPERSVVVEDAISGVRAGRSGGFGLVVGVGDQRQALLDGGADIVVGDVTELVDTEHSA